MGFGLLVGLSLNSGVKHAATLGSHWAHVQSKCLLESYHTYNFRGGIVPRGPQATIAAAVAVEKDECLDGDGRSVFKVEHTRPACGNGLISCSRGGRERGASGPCHRIVVASR